MDDPIALGCWRVNGAVDIHLPFIAHYSALLQRRWLPASYNVRATTVNAKLNACPRRTSRRRTTRSLQAAAPPCTLLTRSAFDALAPTAGDPYSYDGFCEAVTNWNDANPTLRIFSSDSEAIQRRELAAFLGHVLHESGDLVHPRELSQCGTTANSDGTSPWTSGPLYCQPSGYASGQGPYADPYCSAGHTSSSDPDGCDCSAAPEAAGAGYAATGLFFGRGPLQLSWNYNYVDAGDALGVDLCANPDLVAADGEVAWGSGERKRSFANFWFYNEWVLEGRQVDGEGNPVLDKAATEAIVKILLPRIAPEKKWSDYKGMKKGRAWLGSVAGGTTWDAEMDALVRDKVRGELKDNTRLF